MTYKDWNVFTPQVFCSMHSRSSWTDKQRNLYSISYKNFWWHLVHSLFFILKVLFLSYTINLNWRDGQKHDVFSLLLNLPNQGSLSLEMFSIGDVLYLEMFSIGDVIHSVLLNLDILYTGTRKIALLGEWSELWVWQFGWNVLSPFEETLSVHFEVCSSVGALVFKYFFI